MASIISAGTTSGTSLNLSGDTSGVLQLASNGSTTAVTIDTNQRAAFVAGTAALPAITTTGDTNTGIFFSAADTIDFAEGGAATGQFDSSGNFKFNSGYGAVATAYGCRAWVNFNAVGTVTIRASGNVSSISDNGVGLFTVNFTNAMPDTSYSAVASTRRNATSGGAGENNVNNGVNFRGLSTYSTAFTTTALQLCSGTVTNESLGDFDYVAVQVFR